MLSQSPLDSGPHLVRLMTDLGVVQRGADVLTRRNLTPFTLPDEAGEAHDVSAQLIAMADRIAARYPFRAGMGLAAPQIGLARRAALVRPAPPAEPVVLLNPAILDAAPATRAGYEGCLSFFDVRGLVHRPQWIVVEHDRPDGARIRTRFTGEVAGLAGHEIDHLNGVLFDAHVAGGLLPVERYRRLLCSDD